MWLYLLVSRALKQHSHMRGKWEEQDQQSSLLWCANLHTQICISISLLPSSSNYYYFVLWMFLDVTLSPSANNSAQGARSAWRLKKCVCVSIWRALLHVCAEVRLCLCTLRRFSPSDGQPSYCQHISQAKEEDPALNSTQPAKVKNNLRIRPMVWNHYNI